ncbi:MAG: hypothetical protein JXR31_09230 [Prolixibacteraceae bacterium]|nr:hypothetical protein [Prolixibacteraceae bacterium]MBN2774416.1 hypothetical protein [Prolixibacteraceae bacterium]
METGKLVYIISLVLLFIVVLIFSLKKELNIRGQVKYFFPALIISGALFIMFEIRFVEFEVWQYKLNHLVGKYYMSLPVETWLYYIVMLFTGFLIYRIVSIFSPFKINANYFVFLSLVLLAVFAAMAYFYRILTYTFVIFMFLTVYFGYVIFRGKFKKHYQDFYISFLLELVPFFILNILATRLPVITYNSKYITGINLFGVPFENMAGFFLLFLMSISIYEYLLEKRFY